MISRSFGTTEDLEGDYHGTTPGSQAASAMPEQASSSGEPLGVSQPVLKVLQELGVALRKYAAIWIDQARLTIQAGLFRVMLGLIAMVVGVTTIVVSVGLLLIGVAAGIGTLTGAGLWLGQILTGTSVLVATFVALAVWRRSQRAANWKELVSKYEQPLSEPGRELENGRAPGA